MVFRIEITQMPARFDILLELWLLQYKIRLKVKDMAAATAGLSIRGFGALGASALSREASLRPKPTLTDDIFHPLKPPRITRVVIWEIE